MLLWRIKNCGKKMGTTTVLTTDRHTTTNRENGMNFKCQCYLFREFTFKESTKCWTFLWTLYNCLQNKMISRTSVNPACVTPTTSSQPSQQSLAGAHLSALCPSVSSLCCFVAAGGGRTNYFSPLLSEDLQTKVETISTLCYINSRRSNCVQWLLWTKAASTICCFT